MNGSWEEEESTAPFTAPGDRRSPPSAGRSAPGREVVQPGQAVITSGGNLPCQVRHPHCRTGVAGRERRRTGAARQLLPRKPGACGRARHQDYRLPIDQHRRVRLSCSGSCGHRPRYGEAVPRNARRDRRCAFRPLQRRGLPLVSRMPLRRWGCKARWGTVVSYSVQRDNSA